MSTTSLGTATPTWEQLAIETVLKFRDDSHTWKKINGTQLVSVYADGSAGWVPDGTPAVRYSPAWIMTTAEIIYTPPLNEENVAPTAPDRSFNERAAPVAAVLFILSVLVVAACWFFLRS